MNSNYEISPKVGVGLRHKHYQEALTSASAIDFVEVHSENFFAAGGATIDYLQLIRGKYEISLHSTALGLGSAREIPESFLNKLIHLVSVIDPLLVSDHASYAWGSWMDKPVHMGDLLPLSFNKQTLSVLARNVDIAQEKLGRQILIENLSSYVVFSEDEMSEAEFLVSLTEMTGCGLLLDLNNILVSAHNVSVEDNLSYARKWLELIPEDLVKEIHLAGHSPVKKGELIVDDHSQPVANSCWYLYEQAIQRFGNVPTLIEWDNNLPSWQTLVAQADKARRLATEVLNNTVVV